jgi:DNA-binding response OmpR family regulator
MGRSTNLSAEPAADQPYRLNVLGNVRPLQPIRVLLAGRDTRYLRVMRFLLARRGFETLQIPEGSVLMDEAASFAPDVVLLAEARSFGETAAQAAGLLATYDRVNVIISTSRKGSTDTTRLRFVPKWGSFDVLTEAVERSWADLPPAAVD